MLLGLLMNVNRNAALQRKQPLGTAKRVEESCWEMHKDYLKDFEQFLKGTRKLLRNAQIPPAANRRRGRIAQWLSAKT
jgi:hypothetical protein